MGLEGRLQISVVADGLNSLRLATFAKASPMPGMGFFWRRWWKIRVVFGKYADKRSTCCGQLAGLKYVGPLLWISSPTRPLPRFADNDNSSFPALIALCNAETFPSADFAMDSSSELTIFRSLLETMIQLTIPGREYPLNSFIHHINHHARPEDFRSLLEFKRREDCVGIFGVDLGHHLRVEDLHHADGDISVGIPVGLQALDGKFVDVIAAVSGADENCAATPTPLTTYTTPANLTSLHLFVAQEANVVEAVTFQAKLLNFPRWVPR